MDQQNPLTTQVAAMLPTITCPRGAFSSACTHLGAICQNYNKERLLKHYATTGGEKKSSSALWNLHSPFLITACARNVGEVLF